MKMIVPTVKKTRRSFKDVKIDFRESWALQHIRSLEACYNRSPYFEYYKDELCDLFFQPPELLWELNVLAIRWCLKKMHIDKELNFTKDYKHQVALDFRRGEIPFQKKPYNQVFDEKNGFDADLSVLDLLFNRGPESADLLYSSTSSE